MGVGYMIKNWYFKSCIIYNVKFTVYLNEDM